MNDPSRVAAGTAGQTDDDAPEAAEPSALLALSDEHPIVLFDGVCTLCNGSVNWLIDRDKRARLRFGALQWPSVTALLATFADAPPGLDTFILVDRRRLYLRSTAALRALRAAGGVWAWLYPGVIIPRVLRDLVYRFVARNRYKWFGKRESCRIPTPELEARFIPVGE